MEKDMIGFLGRKIATKMMPTRIHRAIIEKQKKSKE
jgi:hypothetical protein